MALNNTSQRMAINMLFLPPNDCALCINKSAMYAYMDRWMDAILCMNV